MTVTHKTIGFRELSKQLNQLTKEGGLRVVRATLGAGLAVIRSAQQAAVPGWMKQTIGSRITVASLEQSQGIVGPGIGSGNNDRARARNAIFFIRGTQPRFRQRIGGKFSYLTRPTMNQLSTGTEAAHDVLSAATTGAMPRARERMTQAFNVAIRKELART